MGYDMDAEITKIMLDDHDNDVCTMRPTWGL